MAEETPQPTPAAGQTKKSTKKPYLIACESDAGTLENTVSKMIMQGYRPHGSLSIYSERNEVYYYQPMIHQSLLRQG